MIVLNDACTYVGRELKLTVSNQTGACWSKITATPPGPPGLLGSSYDDFCIDSLLNVEIYLRQRTGPAVTTSCGDGSYEKNYVADWIDAATKRLKPSGFLSLIQKAERLPEILSGMDDRLGSILVKPLVPRDGRAAGLGLGQARKGGRGAFRLAAPLVIHEGTEHTGDQESYRPEVAAILRDGAQLPLW